MSPQSGSPVCGALHRLSSFSDDSNSGRRSRDVFGTVCWPADSRRVRPHRKIAVTIMYDLLGILKLNDARHVPCLLAFAAR